MADEKTADEHEQEHDMTIKFGGRTVMLTVVINTDEEVDELTKRVVNAARGPLRRMVVCEANLYTDKLATHSLWTKIKGALGAVGVPQKKGPE